MYALPCIFQRLCTMRQIGFSSFGAVILSDPQEYLDGLVVLTAQIKDKTHEIRMRIRDADG